MVEADILAMVDRLYSAVFEPSSWAAIAGELAAAFGGGGAQICVCSPGGAEPLSMTPQVEAIMPAYLAYYHQYDGWLQGGVALPPGSIYASNEHLRDQDVVRTEWYADCLKPMDAQYCLGAIIRIEGSATAMLGIHRPQGRPFDRPEEKQALGMILPHLKRALQVRYRLAEVNTMHVAATAALDRLDMGVVAADSESRVLFMNSAADRLMMRSAVGLSLRYGRLVADSPAAGDRLAYLIREAAQLAHGRAGSLTKAATAVLHLPKAGGHRQVSVLVCPIPGQKVGLGIERPSVLVFIHAAPQANAMTADAYGEILQGLYGLTAAETRVTAGLATGERLADYAKRAGISQHTARTQIKQVLAKTNCRTQAELLRALPRFW